MLTEYKCEECGTDMPPAKPQDRKRLCTDCFNRRWESLLTGAAARGVKLRPKSGSKS